MVLRQAGPALGQRHTLSSHPHAPPRGIDAVTVAIDRPHQNILSLRYRVYGDGALALPGLSSPQRADELWRTTCFELFVRSPGSAEYHEYNFSPSTHWAAYRFDAYRSGMAPLALSRAVMIDRDPPIAREAPDLLYALDATVDLDLNPSTVHAVNLTAVIEEKDGTKSYWALKHPEGAPDFHDATCFVLELPAVG